MKTFLSLSSFVVLYLFFAGSAQADISDSGNMTLGNQAVIAGTVTVQGNAFSVGGSTLAVKNGRVGIGTTSPGSTLSVNGTENIGGSSGYANHQLSVVTASNGFVKLGTGTANSGQENYQITWQNATTQSVDLQALGGHDMAFGTGSNYGQFFIKNGGNVGIATTNPGSSLSVNGTENVGGSSAYANHQLSVVTASNGFVKLGTGTANSGQENYQITWQNATTQSVDLQALGGHDMAFGTGTNYGQVLLKNGGNVGIGTTSPAATLDVNGTAGNHTGVWANLSDRQFKTNIKPMQDALGIVRKLNGVTFEWNIQKLQDVVYPLPKERRKPKRGETLLEPEKPHVNPGTIRGFVAQDVEKVVPEWVKSDPRGFKWFEPAGIDAVLVEALKQVDSENAALKSRLDSQQQQINELQAEIKTLKGR